MTGLSNSRLSISQVILLYHLSYKNRFTSGVVGNTIFTSFLYLHDNSKTLHLRLFCIQIHFGIYFIMFIQYNFYLYFFLFVYQILNLDRTHQSLTQSMWFRICGPRRLLWPNQYSFQFDQCAIIWNCHFYFIFIVFISLYNNFVCALFAQI